MYKILSVFGTRPEAIKMCPLIKSIEKNAELNSIVCVTGQHREMLDSVLEIFNVKPDYDLDIMNHGQSIIDISNKVLKGVDKVIKECNPDLILVHGDTTTTMNATLAAFYNKISVGHVEAGLRSNDIYSPFPEEINRKLTSSIAKYHFAPTLSNVNNLRNEGIVNNVYQTGNTVIDALFEVLDEEYKFKNKLLDDIDYSKKVILLTTHRRENWGDPMRNIFKAVKKVTENNEDVIIIFPMHKNPIIRNMANEFFGNTNEKVKLIEPLEYMDFTNLMNKVYLIMTDSGGVQEEAPSLGKPVVVLRTETERPEAVEAGTIKLVGIDEESIYNSVNELLNDNDKYRLMSNAINPYGDGKACERIVDIIKSNI